MRVNIILIIDAALNLVLGVLLLVFTPELVALIGVPATDTSFYANILGAIFIGITIALILEYLSRSRHQKHSESFSGLGLGGAIVINLCGGIVLALWLLFGDLSIPLRGHLLLWGLVCALVGISSAELISYKQK